MSATTKIWVNGVAPTCDDVDLNGFKNENNNLIVGAGISLSTTDNQQTHKAVAHYAAVGDYYVDSGAVNAYVLGATGSQVAPPTYATGMRIRFVAGNANTGASTVNVDSLGVKALVNDADGSALISDAISATAKTEAYYDGTSFRVTSLPDAGSWTPSLWDSRQSDAEGQTYVYRRGSYSKVGNIVTLSGSLSVSSLGALGGDVQIGGLPFTIYTGSIAPAQGTLFATTGLSPRVAVAQLTVGLLRFLQDDGTPVDASDITPTFQFEFTITFRTD